MPILLIAVLCLLGYSAVEIAQVYREISYRGWWVDLNYKKNHFDQECRRGQVERVLERDRVQKKNDTVGVERTENPYAEPQRKPTKRKASTKIALEGSEPLEVGKLSLDAVLRQTVLPGGDRYDQIFLRLLCQVYQDKCGITQMQLDRLHKQLVARFKHKKIPIKTPNDLLRFFEEDEEERSLLLMLLQGNEGPNISDPFPSLNRFFTTAHLLGQKAHAPTALHFHFADSRLIEAIHLTDGMEEWIQEQRNDQADLKNGGMVRQRIGKGAYLKRLEEVQETDNDVIRGYKAIFYFDIKRQPHPLKTE